MMSTTSTTSIFWQRWDFDLAENTNNEQTPRSCKEVFLSEPNNERTERSRKAGLANNERTERSRKAQMSPNNERTDPRTQPPDVAVRHRPAQRSIGLCD